MAVTYTFTVDGTVIGSKITSTITHFVVNVDRRCNPRILLTTIFVVAGLFARLVAGGTTTTLTFPLTLSVSSRVKIDPVPFFIMVYVTTSTDFSAPVKCRAGLVMRNVNGCGFASFMHVKLPLGVVAFLVSVFLVPLV